MRRSAALALVTGGTLAVGTLAWYRLKGTPKAVSGIFPNGIAYARVGSGPKTMLWILGGPGMGAPIGVRLALLPFVFYAPFIEAGYTVWIIARRQNMPRGHTIADMAEDCAGLIADEFGGKVDLVIGEGPTGGWIGFCLAARHPDRLGHLVTASCGYQLTEQAKTIDHEFARLRVEGRWDDASALQFSSFYPDLRLPGAARVLGVAMGRLLFADSNPYRAHDGMVEAEAEMVFDAREILPQISVPVLLIGGDKDIYTPKEVYEETARLIPGCTLRLYEGKGITATGDTRLPQDVLEFVGDRSQVPEEPRYHVREEGWVEAPIEHVWAFLCDTSRWHDWDPKSEYSDFSGPVDQVGTTFVETSRLMAWDMRAHHTVVEVEPQRLLHHRSDKGFDVLFRLEPDGDVTHLIVDCDYRLPGHLPGAVQDLVGRTLVERTMRETGEKFRALAEATVPVPA